MQNLDRVRYLKLWQNNLENSKIVMEKEGKAR